MQRLIIIPALAVLAIAAIGIGGLRPGSHAADAATNLITNGTFATDVAGWTAEDANIVLSFDGVAGNPPGSAAVQSVQFPAVTSSITQCVVVSPDTSYGISADALNRASLITSVPISDMSAQMIVELFSDGACSTSVDQVAVTAWGVSDAWVTRAATFQTPGNVASALMKLTVTGPSFCGFQPTVFFDNVRFEYQTPTPVRAPRTHTPTRTAMESPSSTPTPSPVVRATATLPPQPTVDAVGVGGVRAGGISPPSTGSGPGVYGPSAPRAQVAPNGC